MKTITLNQVPAAKAQDIRDLNARRYDGRNCDHTSIDTQIQFIENMSADEYLELYNRTADKVNLESAAKERKRKEVVEDRKASGMSKKAYRAEYDRLMAEYKAGNRQAKEEAKKIQRFAFA